MSIRRVVSWVATNWCAVIQFPPGDDRLVEKDTTSGRSRHGSAKSDVMLCVALIRVAPAGYLRVKQSRL